LRDSYSNAATCQKHGKKSIAKGHDINMQAEYEHYAKLPVCEANKWQAQPQHSINMQEELEHYA